ncbi:MAG TPA: HAD family phosphatase [Paludibacter sp.]|nr:HAD family phosphatase [Paludibacter sp.]
MKHFSNISTLIFDFGGVLIDLDMNQSILNFKKLGIKNVENYLSNFGQSGFFMQLEKGEISAEEFRSEIRKMTPNTITDSEINDAWNAFLVRIPSEKLDIVYELRKKYRVIMLSNTNVIHFPYAEQTFFSYKNRSINEYFDKCYRSYDMKMVKPDTEIFEAILSQEQVAANRCLLLDDGPKNIEQAHKLGFQTYFVDPNEDLSFLLTNIN